jgi:hypothetical protein
LLRRTLPSAATKNALQAAWRCRFPLWCLVGALDALPCKGNGLKPIARDFPTALFATTEGFLVDAFKCAVDFPQPRTRVLQQADGHLLAGIVGAELRPVFDRNVGQVVHDLPIGQVKRLVRLAVNVAFEVPLKFQQLMPKVFHVILYHPVPH